MFLPKKNIITTNRELRVNPRFSESLLVAVNPGASKYCYPTTAIANKIFWQGTGSSGIDLGPVPTGVNYTVLAEVNNPGLFEQVVFGTRTTGSSTGFELNVGYGSDARNYTLRNVGANITSTIRSSDIQTHTYIFTHDNSTPLTTVYLDGASIVTGNLGSIASHAQNLFLFRRGATYSTSRVGAFALWTRILPAPEIAYLLANPEDLFERPDRKIIYFGSQASSTIHTTTGALTGQSSTLAGTAGRLRAFSASGSIPGQSSQISGSASRVGAAVTHATDGSLTGQSSSIVGTSARVHAFSSTGALSGQGSTVAGTAARAAPGTHPALGDLIGQNSIIVGSAARVGNHATSGDLTGQSAAVIGVSVHNITHATTGDITSSGASIAGIASKSGQISLSEADINAIVDAIWARAALEQLPVNVLKMNSAEVVGTGSITDKWRGV